MLPVAKRLQPCLRLDRFKACGIKRYNSNVAARQHAPLNILFCGADEFSIYSLRALRALQDAKPEKIASVDVVCRPDKRVGRGLKQIQEVPIKSVAQDLGLQLHQIDTFRGWSPPTSINLVIAVSFGLLVPARILNGATYGGLNVHPSLLPDLRGPAPIIHALLKQRSHTGVTLQTMHPTRFDHGTIIDQTPAPGLSIPSSCTPDQLLKTLGPLGAEMLCRGIDDGLFVPPVKDIRESMADPEPLDHAPKLTPEDRHIDWSAWTTEDILVRDRVLGRLWDRETYSRCLEGRSAKRVTFHGPWIEESADFNTSQGTGSIKPGQPLLLEGLLKDPQLGIVTADRRIMIPASVTIEGEGRGKGLPALINGLREARLNSKGLSKL